MSALVAVSSPTLTVGGDPVPACESYPPDMMFPESEAKTRPGGGKNRWVEDAKAVCAECPLRASCLDGALARREPHGIWGGLTTREREALRRRRYGRRDPDEQEALAG